MGIKQLPARFHHYNKCKPDNLQEAYRSFPFQKLVMLFLATWYKQLNQIVFKSSHLSLRLYTLHHPVPCKLAHNRAFDLKSSSWCWLGNIYWEQSKWHIGMFKKWKVLVCLEFLQRNIMNHYTHYMSIFIMKQNLVLALSELLIFKR